MFERPWYLLAALLAASPAGATPQQGAQAASTDAVAHGEYLARMGDCVACHTAPGGKPYAGGLYLNSSFGQIASQNITPDQKTGIGAWSDDQFYDALHRGLDKDGNYLYPAMPYERYTRVTRDDVLAIKAYLFSLPPADAPEQPNHLVFPFNIRAGIGGWNALYFKEGTFQPDPSKPAQWNRGAYIVTGLGHCAACHTPRNAAQAPIDSEAFSGGIVDNWYAPNITSDPKEGIGTWSENDIVAYLKKGAAQGKGVSFGPMAQTVHDSLSHLTDDDLHAIAVYLKSLPPKRSYKETTAQNAYVREAGVQVYLTNCASCHQPNGQGLGQSVPPLAGNGVVAAKGPDDVIRAVLGGLPAQESYGPMPGYATVLSPQQVADVTNYIRTSWGNGAPANATPDLVARLLPKSRTMLAATHWCKNPGNDPLGARLNDPSTGVTEFAAENQRHHAAAAGQIDRRRRAARSTGRAARRCGQPAHRRLLPDRVQRQVRTAGPARAETRSVCLHRLLSCRSRRPAPGRRGLARTKLGNGVKRPILAAMAAVRIFAAWTGFLQHGDPSSVGPRRSPPWRLPLRRLSSPARSIRKARCSANLMVQALRAHGLACGKAVCNSAPPPSCAQALQSGVIDIYPEYTGNAAQFHDREGDPAWHEPTSAWRLGV